MTASSVPMPHIPTAVMHGSVGLGKPPSHEGRIEEGDGGGTVGPAEEARAKKERKRAVRTVPRASHHLVVNVVIQLTRVVPWHCSIRSVRSTFACTFPATRTHRSAADQHHFTRRSRGFAFSLAHAVQSGRRLCRRHATATSLMVDVCETGTLETGAKSAQCVARADAGE